jgi:hypothetical protein
MVLSLGFFSYAWALNHNAFFPILPGAYVVKWIHAMVRLPVWINQLLFFILNGVFWAGIVFLVWSAVGYLPGRRSRAAT